MKTEEDIYHWVIIIGFLIFTVTIIAAGFLIHEVFGLISIATIAIFLTHIAIELKNKTK